MDLRDSKPKFDLNKIDFDWVEKTDNLKELKAAYRALVEDQGGYVDLERTLKEKIEKLDPKFARPANNISPEEMKSLESDLQNWTSKMQSSEEALKVEEKKVSIENEANAEKAKQAGNDYLRAKDYDQALESYTRAINLNPHNAAAYFNRALVFLKQKKFKKAAEDCDKAIIIKENYGKAYQRRAEAYIELKEYEKAVPDLEKALELQPENEEANAKLKKCRDELNSITGYRRIQIVEVDDDEEAEESEIKITENKDEEESKVKEHEIESLKPEPSPVRLHPPASPKHILVDEAEFIEAKQEEEALEIILDSHNTEEFIKNIEAVKQEGNKFFKIEDFDGALNEFTKGIASIERYYDEAKVLLDAKLLQLAITLYNNRALAHSRLDLNNEAIQDCLKVLKLDQNNTKALYRIGKCEASRNNYNEAAKSMKKLLSIEPNNEVAKKDYEDYTQKFHEAQRVLTEKVDELKKKERKKSQEETIEVKENLERRVSFRDDDAKPGTEKRSSLMKKLSFKTAEAKFPKKNTDDEDESGSDEEEVKTPHGLSEKVKEIDKPRPRKQPGVEISQETIKNAKEIASKLVSHEEPKNYLMFEAAAKALQHDPAAFYQYLKSVSVTQVPVLFEKNEFSVELINQCVQSLENREFDVTWATDFFKAIPSTSRFSTVIKLFSRSEKAKLKSLFEKLGSEELSHAFNLN